MLVLAIHGGLGRLYVLMAILLEAGATPRPLFVAHSLDEIKPSIDSAFREPMPGFQVDPICKLEDVLVAVTAAVRPYLPGFEFNGRMPGGEEFETEQGDLPRHLDEGLINRGVALQIGKGRGWVEMALSKYGTSRNELGRRRLKKIQRNVVGQWYRGEIYDDLITVIAEGLSTADFKLGAAYHDFHSYPGEVRQTARYNYHVPYE